MDAMTLYVPRNSPIHHLDPLTKMLYVVVSIAAAYLLDDLWQVAAVMLTSFGILLVGKRIP